MIITMLNIIKGTIISQDYKLAKRFAVRGQRQTADNV